MCSHKASVDQKNIALKKPRSQKTRINRNKF